MHNFKYSESDNPHGPYQKEEDDDDSRDISQSQYSKRITIMILFRYYNMQEINKLSIR